MLRGTIESFRVLDNHVEPERRFNLFHNMSESGSHDYLDWFFFLAKRQEKVYYALANTNLLSLLMDVLIRRKEKQYFCVRVIFILRLGHFWGL
jgi:hypothetical protein